MNRVRESSRAASGTEARPATARTESRRARPRAVHFSDYLAIVRDHLLAAGTVGLGILAWVVLAALFSTPVYEARSRLQIDVGGQQRDDLVSDLMLFGTSTVQSTEVEVIRSYAVAKRVADDPVARATALLEEKSVYRPLETLVRPYLHASWRPCHLEFDPAHLPSVRRTASWKLSFDAQGRLTISGAGAEAVTVERVGLGEPFEDRNENGVWDAAEPYEDQNGNAVYDAPVPFDVGGQHVALVLEEGDVRGRTFLARLRSPEEAATWVHEATSVEPVGDWSGIVDVTVRAESPVVATRIADAVGRAYLGLRQERRRERTDRTLDWLKAETKRVEDDLLHAVDARDAYVKQTGATMLTEQATGIYERQGELVRQRFELEQRKLGLDAELALLAGTHSTDELLTAIGATSLDARTTTLVQQEADLEMQRALLLRSLTDRDPKVEEVDAKIAFVRDQLTASIGGLVTERRNALDVERSQVAASLAQIDREEARQQRLLSQLPDAERKLVELGRPIESNETFLVSLKKSQKEVEMARAGAVATASVIDPAVANPGRKSPVLLKTLIVGVLLGLLGGVGTAFGLEYMNRTVRSSQEIEDGLGVPVLGTIPLFRSVDRRLGRRGQGALVAEDAPRSAAAEPYRTLFASIRYPSTEAAVRTVVVTSSLAQEGKTVTTLNLAITMARAGRKVLVVDADTRRPTTHVHLGGTRDHGLVDVLEGQARWQDVVRATQTPGMSLVAAGHPAENPTALLDSDAFRSFLAEVRDAFDYVLFDAPPVLAVADAAAFVRELDAVVLLVRQGRYPLDTARAALEQIERLGGKVQGAVLNAFDLRRAARTRVRVLRLLRQVPGLRERRGDDVTVPVVQGRLAPRPARVPGAPRVAVCHPRLGHGGSEARALWLLQALRAQYDVTLVTLGPVDLPRLNAYYGTRLEPSDLCVSRPRVGRWLARRASGDALRTAVLERHVRSRAAEYDLLISAHNLLDFGRPGIQFIADWSFLPHVRRSLHGSTSVLDGRGPGRTCARCAYRSIVRAVRAGRASPGPRSDDYVIANSAFTARMMVQHLGRAPDAVLYPPVGGPPDGDTHEERRPDFVSLGRIRPEKRIPDQIEILRNVRARGHDVSLRLCGGPVTGDYAAHIRRLVHAEAGWVSWDGPVEGAAKWAVLSAHRFGIHATRGEGFGIATAEMIRAGCIVFAPDHGGPAELLDEPGLTYGSLGEATEKIALLLGDPARQARLAARLRDRGARFTEEAFTSRSLDVVREVLERGVRRRA